MALAKKYTQMARFIETLSNDEWTKLKYSGYEYGVKLAEMIDNGLIDALSRTGKQTLTEAYDAAKKLNSGDN